jgi:hypothetical protein
VGKYFGSTVAVKKIVVKDEREMVLIKREVEMLRYAACFFVCDSFL